MTAKRRKKRGPGAPTLFTPARQRRILAYLRKGAFLGQAAEATGVSAQTFRVWLSRGDEERKGKFRTFMRQVRQARAAAQTEIAMRLFKQDPIAWALYGPGRARGPGEEGFRRRDEVTIDVTGRLAHGPTIFDAPGLVALGAQYGAELARLERARALAAPADGPDDGADVLDALTGGDPAGTVDAAALGARDEPGPVAGDAAPRALERGAHEDRAP